MLGDKSVSVSTSRGPTFRQTIALAAGGTETSQEFYVWGHPRVFVWANQLGAGAAQSVQIDFALRDSATPGTPEWLEHSVIVLVPGGATPTTTLLTVGAVWIRFTVIDGIGGAGGVVELAASAFV